MKNSPLLLLIRTYNPFFIWPGVAFIVGGIFAALIVDTTNWWNITLMSLGTILLILFLIANLTEVKAVGKRRSTVAQANIILVSIAVSAIVIGVNYIVNRHPVTFDMTSNKLYTLSDQTLDILKNLKQDVTVTFFTSAKKSSAEIQKAQQLLQEYAKKTTKFHFETVDIDKNPTDAKRLGIHEYNTVVFESGDNRKDVLQRDYVTYAMQGRQPMPKFQGEGAFTSALVKMADTTHLNFYFTQGHGERDFNNPQPEGLNMFKDLLEKENYTLKTLDLLTTGKIPDDAAVIAILGPSKPFSSSEIDLLEKYLSQGGKLVICVDPTVKSGLEPLLKIYGVKFGDDLVVDTTSYAFPDIRALVPQYIFQAIVEKLSDDHIASILPFWRSVQKINSDLKTYPQTVFLQTTDKGWGITNMKEKKPVYHPGVDTKGLCPWQWPLNWTPDSTASPNTNSPKKTRLVVYGNSSFLSNQFIQQFGNLDLALNTFSWAAEEENKITVHPKEDDIRQVDLSNVSVNIIYYLTVWILPLSILATGIFVWYRRRSL